jgi:hypothetical protein
MKRILPAAILALGLMVTAADSARAHGGCSGSFGFGISCSWFCRSGCDPCCGPCSGSGYCPPAMYGAYPNGSGFGPYAPPAYPGPLAGYGAPYTPYADHGYPAPFHGYAGGPGYGAPGAVAGYGAPAATYPVSHDMNQGYGY